MLEDGRGFVVDANNVLRLRRRAAVVVVVASIVAVAMGGRYVGRYGVVKVRAMVR